VRAEPHVKNWVYASSVDVKTRLKECIPVRNVCKKAVPTVNALTSALALTNGNRSVDRGTRPMAYASIATTRPPPVLKPAPVAEPSRMPGHALTRCAATVHGRWRGWAMSEGLEKAKALAAKLDGREYLEEITSKLRKQAIAENLVIVFGGSDDLMEFDGAISEEVSAWKGTTVYLSPAGIYRGPDCCGVPAKCGFVAEIQSRLKSVEAKWCGGEGYTWTFKTDIPHATFDIYEDGEQYCRGIVFHLSDAKTQDSSEVVALKAKLEAAEAERDEARARLDKCCWKQLRPSNSAQIKRCDDCPLQSHTSTAAKAIHEVLCAVGGEG